MVSSRSENQKPGSSFTRLRASFRSTASSREAPRLFPSAKISPTAVEVTSMAPSAAPTRTRVRICTRCGIHARFRVDGVVFDHDSRRRYDDRATNYDGVGHHRSRLFDNKRRRSRVLVRSRIAFAVASYRQIGGHCRRGKSECTCRTQDQVAHLSAPLLVLLSPVSRRTRKDVVRFMNGCSTPDEGG
jgi:hypothetical protein